MPCGTNYEKKKMQKKVWLTLPAATEDSHAILLEELILTGAYCSARILNVLLK